MYKNSYHFGLWLHHVFISTIAKSRTAQLSLSEKMVQGRTDIRLGRFRQVPDFTRFQIENRKPRFYSFKESGTRKRRRFWSRALQIPDSQSHGAGKIPDSQSRSSCKIPDSEDQLPASVKIPDSL